MSDKNLSELERRMTGAMEVLQKEFAGLRTGRASTNLLEHIQVEAYGSMMPINQLGNVSVPEPRLLTVQVWDTGTVKAVEKAIANAGLGLNPQPAGNVIRVPIPELSEERRKELAKVAAKYTEQARVAVRNVRRDGMDLAKKLEKDGELSEDDRKRMEDNVQKLTDKWIKKIDEALAAKEKEIQQI